MTAQTTSARTLPAGLKAAIDFGPLLVFLAGYWLSDIFKATIACMVASVAAIVVAYALTRRLPIPVVVTGLIVMVFGGLTVYLQDERFFKMKPTIVYTLFAVTLLGGLVFGKALLRHMFEFAFQVDDEGWRKLTLRWGLFFVVMAIANELVWRNFAEQTWVYFKVFGLTALTFVFALSQVPLMQRHTIEEPAAGKSGEQG